MEIPELRSSKRDDTWCGPLVEPASNSSKLNLCNAKPTSSSLLSLFEELTSTGHSRKVVVEDIGDFVLLCSDVGFVGIGIKNDYFLTDRASEQDGRFFELWFISLHCTSNIEHGFDRTKTPIVVSSF